VLEPAEKYQEITKDFTVQKLYTGMELYSIKAFEYTGNTLSAESIQALNDIKEMLKKNRNLSIAITLLPDIAPPPVQIAAPVIKSEKFGYTNSDNAKTQKYKCLQRLKRYFFEEK
jgi:hypothetical protein